VAFRPYSFGLWTVVLKSEQNVVCGNFRTQNIWSVVVQGLKHLVWGGLLWSVVVCGNKDAIDLVCGGF